MLILRQKSFQFCTPPFENSTTRIAIILSHLYIFRLPYLQEGNDLVNFQIAEDTTVGSIVYTLKGIDPEGVKVTYTISGDHFSVTRETGVITLRAPLDREVEELIEVVVTVQVFFFFKNSRNTLF